MVEVGQIISGKYKLLRLLGDGGMGSVYEAEHVNLGTHAAIKGRAPRRAIARRAPASRSASCKKHGFRRRFAALTSCRSRTSIERLTASRISSWSSCKASRCPASCGASGSSPSARRANTRPRFLQALEAAHALGVIHRDLKPDNVFVTFTGGKPVLKLIDFGIAKLKTEQTGKTKNLTVAGMLMGTPEYMAPEQAYSADKVDVRADLYAVGVMLYEMLSGASPVEAGDPRVLIGKVERGEITPLVQAAPGIEPTLAGLVHRAMAPRPELRYATATEMRIALEDHPERQARQAPRRFQRRRSSPNGGQRSAQPVAPTTPNPEPPMARGPSTPLAAPIFRDACVLRHADAARRDRSGARRPDDVGQMNGPQYGSGPPPPAYAPPPGYAQQQAPAYQPPPQQYERRKPGNNGLIVALAAVALLLGGGAVVTRTCWRATPTKAFVPARADRSHHRDAGHRPGRRRRADDDADHAGDVADDSAELTQPRIPSRPASGPAPRPRHPGPRSRRRRAARTRARRCAARPRTRRTQAEAPDNKP